MILSSFLRFISIVSIFLLCLFSVLPFIDKSIVFMCVLDIVVYENSKSSNIAIVGRGNRVNFMLGFSRRCLGRSLRPFPSTNYVKQNISSRNRFFTSNTTEAEDFGLYNVILPEQPFVFGVSHIQPRRLVPEHIIKPAYALNADGAVPAEDVAPKPRKIAGKIKLGGEEEKRVREAAKLAARVREFAGTLAKVRRYGLCTFPVLISFQPGATTLAIDEAVHNFIISHLAYPSPLNYQGFPRSCCTRCTASFFLIFFQLTCGLQHQ